MSNPNFSPTNNLEDEFISDFRELLKKYKVKLVRFEMSGEQPDFYFTNDGSYREVEIFISSDWIRDEIGYEDRE